MYSTSGGGGGPRISSCHMTEKIAKVHPPDRAAMRQRLWPAWRHTETKSLTMPRGLTWRQKLEGRRSAIAAMIGICAAKRQRFAQAGVYPKGE